MSGFMLRGKAIIPYITLKRMPFGDFDALDYAPPDSRGRSVTRISTGWCPQLESNQHLRLRSPLLYPLSYGGFRLTPMPELFIGFTPMTIRTPDFTFFNLSNHRFPRKMTRQHACYIPRFLFWTSMVKLKNNRVFLPTINTCSLREVL